MSSNGVLTVQRALPRSLARASAGLGVFSLGLGLAEVVAPRRVTCLIGIRDRRAAHIARGFGFREIAAGLAVLTRRRPSGGLWARVAGDALGLAFLALALGPGRARRSRVLPAIAAIAGIAALDVYIAIKAGGLPIVKVGGPVRRAVTVAMTPEEAYRFWRELQNLPRFMRHVDSVEALDSARSHWRVRGPAGRVFEWDAEIVEDRTGEVIRWRSIAQPGGRELGHRLAVANGGTVRFRVAPANRGTEVEVALEYMLPGGELGGALTSLSEQAVALQLENDLHRFKRLVETGDVVRSAGGGR